MMSLEIAHDPYDQTQRTVGYCDVHNAGNSAGFMLMLFIVLRVLNEQAESKFCLGEERVGPPQLESYCSNEK
ncbi:MAG: hypothetical protein ACLTTW_07605 [Coprobacter sp.]